MPAPHLSTTARLPHRPLLGPPPALYPPPAPPLTPPPPPPQASRQACADLERQADNLRKQLALTTEALEAKDGELEELRWVVGVVLGWGGGRTRVGLVCLMVVGIVWGPAGGGVGLMVAWKGHNGVFDGSWCSGEGLCAHVSLGDGWGQAARCIVRRQQVLTCNN